MQQDKHIQSNSSIHGILRRPEADEPEGLALEDLAKGTMLEAETAHHTYRIQNRGDGKVMISGHPEYCPSPVAVDAIGSTWGGGSLRMNFIGKGARLEFWHPEHGIVCTSRVLNVREAKPLS